jgi:hypothetical protein
LRGVSVFRRGVNDICALLGQWQSPLEWEQIQVLFREGNPVLAAPPRKKRGLPQQRAEVTLAHHSAERLVPCTASDKDDYFRVTGKLLLEAR